MNFKEFLKESKETSTIEVSVDYFEDGEYEATFSTTEDVGDLFKTVYNELNKKNLILYSCIATIKNVF